MRQSFQLAFERLGLVPLRAEHGKPVMAEHHVIPNARRQNCGSDRRDPPALREQSRPQTPRGIASA